MAIQTKSKTATAATPGIADKEDPPKNDANNKTKTTTFFLLDVVGLRVTAPTLVTLTIPLLLWYSRQIPFWDCFFSIAFPLYLCLANRFMFDNNATLAAARKERGQPLFPEKSEFFKEAVEPWFGKYMISAAMLGVLLPLVVQVLAPLPIAEAVAPPLYTLLCQILMEMMASGPMFHPLLAVMVPIGFNAYRIAGLKTWCVLAWKMVSSTYNQHGNSINTVITWEMVHFLLALSNAFLWTYNLFVMKLLRQLPQSFDRSKFPDADVLWKYQLIPIRNSFIRNSRSDDPSKTD